LKSLLQNKIAESEVTLPVCALTAVALWWLPERTFSIGNLLGLVLCLLTTYIVMETNTRYHIIRIRTRMMSCVWLVLTVCLSFMHPLDAPLIAAGFLCSSYHLLFRSYQRHRPQLIVFHAFLMLGLGSFFAPVMLLMAIPFYLYLFFFLRSLTWKGFWAGMLGLIVPYWCYGAWNLLIHNTVLDFQATDYSLFTLSPIQFFTLSPIHLFNCAVIALLSIVSIVHYLRTNYDDKIRVRMILYIYVWQTLLLMAFLVLQPEHYQTTLALIVASASPLIAHFFALSKSIPTTIFFLLSLLLTSALAVLNLWTTSFSIS